MTTAVALDADSLIWRYLADRRFVMSICRAVSLQMLHPAIAVATHEFSIVPTRVFVHKQRTAPCIIRSAYEPDFDKIRHIRYSHDSFRSQTPDGKRFHALNPEIFFFEHSTYVDALFTCVEHFFGGLDDDGKDRLYAETCEWYRRYGISDRLMPATLGEFYEYFDHALATETDPHPGYDWYRDQLLRPDHWFFKKVPTSAVRALQHPVAVDRLGITVSNADRRSLALFAQRLRVRDALTPARNVFPDHLAPSVLEARSRA